MICSGRPIMHVHFGRCIYILSINAKAAITPLLLGDHSSIPAENCLVSVMSGVWKIKTSAMLGTQGVLDSMENCVRMTGGNGAEVSAETACVQFHAYETVSVGPGADRDGARRGLDPHRRIT